MKYLVATLLFAATGIGTVAFADQTAKPTAPSAQQAWHQLSPEQKHAMKERHREGAQSHKAAPGHMSGDGKAKMHQRMPHRAENRHGYRHGHGDHMAN